MHEDAIKALYDFCHPEIVIVGKDWDVSHAGPQQRTGLQRMAGLDKRENFFGESPSAEREVLE
jgi:hypothetical protein